MGGEKKNNSGGGAGRPWMGRSAAFYFPANSTKGGRKTGDFMAHRGPLAFPYPKTVKRGPSSRALSVGPQGALKAKRGGVSRPGVFLPAGDQFNQTT